MDYKTHMNNVSQNNLGELMETNFNAFYEEVIEKIFASCNVYAALRSLLKNKRKLGLEKYKEYSFQNSMKNSMASPTFEHILEELLDCLNYLAHEHFKASLKYPQLLVKIRDEIFQVTEICNHIKEMMRTISSKD